MIASYFFFMNAIVIINLFQRLISNFPTSTIFFHLMVVLVFSFLCLYYLHDHMKENRCREKLLCLFVDRWGDRSSLVSSSFWSCADSFSFYYYPHINDQKEMKLIKDEPNKETMSRTPLKKRWTKSYVTDRWCDHLVTLFRSFL